MLFQTQVNHDSNQRGNTLVSIRIRYVGSYGNGVYQGPKEKLMDTLTDIAAQVVAASIVWVLVAAAVRALECLT